MSEELLRAINERFQTYAGGAGADDGVVLSDRASAEAQDLWRQASTDGNAPIPVRQALAWFHWARYNALPQGSDLNDLQAALIFFAVIFLFSPDDVPDAVKQFLESGEATDIIDNNRIPARRDDSYVSLTYPNAASYLLELKHKITHVPMPSSAKPDIDGFREGDRVKLTAPFKGQRSQYPIGSTATILVPNTSPASIDLSRSTGLVHLYIDDGSLVQMKIGEFERIPGQSTVIYTPDQESFTIRLP